MITYELSFDPGRLNFAVASMAHIISIVQSEAYNESLLD